MSSGPCFVTPRLISTTDFPTIPSSTYVYPSNIVILHVETSTRVHSILSSQSLTDCKTRTHSPSRLIIFGPLNLFLDQTHLPSFLKVKPTRRDFHLRSSMGPSLQFGRQFRIFFPVQFQYLNPRYIYSLPFSNLTYSSDLIFPYDRIFSPFFNFYTPRTVTPYPPFSPSFQSLPVSLLTGLCLLNFSSNKSSDLQVTSDNGHS